MSASHPVARLRQAVLLVGPDAVQHLDREVVPLDARRGDARGDLLDEGDVVGPESQPDRPPATVEQESHGERGVVRVDLALVAVGDGGGFVVGALDEADGGIEREEAFDVGRRTPEIRLEADAGVRLGRAQPLVDLDRGVRVGAALHVDPQVRVVGRRVRGEPLEMDQAGVGVVIEAELGRLDGDLAVDAGGLDPVDQRPVVRGDLVRLREALEVLAEARVERADAGGLEGDGRGQRVIHRLAGHEPADGTPHEPEAGQTFLQPAIPGCPEEDPTHPVSSHGPWSSGRLRWYATSRTRIAVL